MFLYVVANKHVHADIGYNACWLQLLLHILLATTFYPNHRPCLLQRIRHFWGLVGQGSGWMRSWHNKLFHSVNETWPWKSTQLYRDVYFFHGKTKGGKFLDFDGVGIMNLYIWYPAGDIFRCEQSQSLTLEKWVCGWFSRCSASHAFENNYTPKNLHSP